VKPSHASRSALPGGIALAIAALVIAPTAPLHAQASDRARAEERDKGQQRGAQRPTGRAEGGRAAGQPEPAPAGHAGGGTPAPAGRAPGAAQAPAGRAPGASQAPGPAAGGTPLTPTVRTPGGGQPPVGRPAGMTPIQGRFPGGQPSGPAAPHEVFARPAPGPGATMSRTRDGGQVFRGPGGAVREVRTPGGAVIHYAPNGMRQVEVARPDGRVVFANGNGRGGFVQRPFMVHNQSFEQRTFVEHGVVSVRVYRPWVYGGVTYHAYMPMHYYHPAFYSWTYHPWGAPVYYRWGWGGRPWFGYYGRYYQPYPYYASPLFWLTDFMLAATFEAAYQANLDNGVPPPPPPTASYQSDGMTPEVKQAIADEVRRQVDQERAEQQAASQGYPPPPSVTQGLFSDNVSRIFLVSGSVLAYDRGREVHLAEGDVLRLDGPPAPNATYADVVIMASGHRVLPKGSVVSVSLADLQDMQNHMRASIDQGLGDLQAHQGQDGLPPLPAQQLGTTDAPYAGAVQPDPGAASELAQVAQEAGNPDLSAAGPAAPAPATPGRTVTPGMTEAEVQSILGSPKEVANVGNRKIEVFQNFKVTFTYGQVTDIQ